MDQTKTKICYCGHAMEVHLKHPDGCQTVVNPQVSPTNQRQCRCKRYKHSTKLSKVKA